MVDNKKKLLLDKKLKKNLDNLNNNLKKKKPFYSFFKSRY